MGKTRGKVDRSMALRMAQMADEGIPIAEIARTFGVTKQTTLVHLDTIRPESLEARQKHAKTHRERLNVPWEKAVDEIGRVMSTDNWSAECLRRYARRFECSRSTIRDLMIDAAVRVHKPINPYYLSAIFVDCLESLRRIGAKAERTGDLPTATGAYKSAGALIAVITKSADRPLELGEAKRDMTASELIAKGWTPPVPKGLPKPFLMDPEAVETEPTELIELEKEPGE